MHPKRRRGGKEGLLARPLQHEPEPRASSRRGATQTRRRDRRGDDVATLGGKGSTELKRRKGLKCRTKRKRERTMRLT